MNQEEDFDDLIRQKFAEKEFVFNEENWEKAEIKIEAVRRLSKVSLWTTIFVTGLFIGVGLTFLFVGKGNTGNTQNISEINQQNDSKNETLNKENSYIEKLVVNPTEPPASALISKQQHENTLSIKENEQENPVEMEPVSETKDNPKPENSTEAITRNSKDQALASKNSHDLSAFSLNENNKEKIIAKKENKISAKKTKRITNKINDLNEPIHKNDVQETAQPLNKNRGKVETNTSDQEKNSQTNNNVASLAQNRSNEKVNTEIQSNDPVLTQNEEVKNNGSTSLTTSIENNANNQAEIDSEKNNSSASLMQNTVDEKLNNEPQAENIVPAQLIPIPLTIDSTIQKTDSSSVALQNNINAPAPVVIGGLASATFFSIEAGTNIQAGWEYADASEARGFNPVFGIGITHFINQKWSLLSGIEYGSIAYLKASQKTVTNTTYGFGSISVDKVIDTRLLHYTIVPIFFQYHSNDKNNVSIGGSISYLVNSKSKVTINTTTIAPMQLDSNQTGSIPNQMISTESTETGYYTNAFNKWDVSLAVGYRRRVLQNFSIAAIANFGLLDVKDNTFFAREKFERNIGLKIIISYNLFDF